MTDAVHVFPLNDQMSHELEEDDCPCGPTNEGIRREDGSYGWVIVHHSLDGREKSE